MSAVDAVSQGAELLSMQVSQFKYLALVSQKEAEKQFLRRSIPDDMYNKPVEELSLSTRTLNCLRRGGISTVGQLLEKSEVELFALRSFGQKAKAEVQERVEALGLGSLFRDKGQAEVKAAPQEAEGGPAVEMEEAGPGEGDT